MSNKKSSDEKAVLGVACVAAVALIAFGVLGITSMSKSFQLKPAKNRDLAELETKSTLGELVPNLTDAPQVGVSELKDRKLGLMTSVPLFKIPGHSDLIDLLKDSGEPVHAPIPNSFWLTHGIDPSFKNAPLRDFDGDGFSNIEEFEEGTNPADNKSFPNLIAKLKVDEFEALQWQIYFSSDLGENQYQFRYQDLSGKKYKSDYVGGGADLFEESAGRFTLVEVQERSIEKRGMTAMKKFAIIKDNKKGMTFEIPRGRQNDYIGKDYTVAFELNAGAAKGNTFEVKENNRFDLPSGDVSANGQYFFEKVEEDKFAIVKCKSGGELVDFKISLN